MANRRARKASGLVLNAAFTTWPLPQSAVQSYFCIKCHDRLNGAIGINLSTLLHPFFYKMKNTNLSGNSGSPTATL